MFSKLLIFSFCFLGVFGLIMATMPTEFASQAWNAGYIEKEAAEYFSMANVTQYQNVLNFNISYPGSKQYDFGLPSGQKIEFWWDQKLMGTAGWQKVFQVRHLTDQFWGYWYGWHALEFDRVYFSTDKTILFKGDLEHFWDDSINASLFWCECDHIRTNVLFIPYNSSWTIGESWDNDELKVVTSYEMDWNATGLSSWTILGQLLTFQSPNLGIGGIGGTILNTLIALPVWVSIAICVIKLVQSMIPFIKGTGN